MRTEKELLKEVASLLEDGCGGIGDLTEKEMNSLRLSKDFEYSEIDNDSCPVCSKSLPCANHEQETRFYITF